MTPTPVAGPAGLRRLFEFRSLMVAAAILHLSVTLGIFTVGKYQLFPSQFSPTGVGKFAADGEIYKSQVEDLSRMLKSEGLRAWATWPSQLHVRLYALPLAVVSRWSGLNVLVIEPLNLFYYLAILFCVFRITRSIFSHRVGLIAVTIVALWPSFLLHSTQLLRDPLLILAALVFVWCLVELVQWQFSWRTMLVMWLATIVSLVTIRIVRLPMWNVLLVAMAAAVALFVFRAVRRKQLYKTSVAYALLAIATFLIIPSFQPYFHNQQELGLGYRRMIENEVEQTLPLEDQISRRRDAFSYVFDSEGCLVVLEDGSRIDGNVRLNSIGAIIRQVPRALEIGLFAPFPNMWLKAGRQVGYSGRVMAGFETILIYVIESLALLGFWQQRKNPAAWLLLIVIGVGAVALGLVVINIGAMYRLRYPFWVLMAILAAGGVTVLIDHFKISKSVTITQPENSPVD